MAEATQVAKQMCTYKHGDWGCPFDAEEGRDLCIFHLPIDKKSPEDFWRHLANYLLELAQLHDPPVRVQVQAGQPWLMSYSDPQLRNYYRVRRPLGGVRCAGFVFPAMDEKHSFRGFAFSAAVFTYVVFCGEANFHSAEFSDDTSFFGVHFRGKSIFSYAKFRGRAVFATASLDGEADFQGTKFGGEANFNAAVFRGKAHFLEADFGSVVYFFYAMFGADTSFNYTTFSGPVSFRKAMVKVQLSLTGARLRNKLMFDGTTLADKARVLLWEIDFVHGTSDVEMEKGLERGQIVEPAGQIEFRDITAGMNCVSFLHTDILTDRLLVRFANVKWKTDPKQFIFDARFAFCQDSTCWPEATGLPKNEIASLAPMFHAEQLGPSDETLEQREQRAAKMLADCVPLVMQDVERIAREIRLSYEKYGHYGDAGDYYVAEMDFRSVRLPRRAWLKRPAMWIYRSVSLYGESPTRAAFVLLGILGAAALVYLFTGFAFQGKPVQQKFTLNPNHWTLPVLDYAKALLFALANVVPGYFRIQSDKLASTSGWTTAVSMIQAVFGATTLTLFLLAIRRRFRR